METDYGSNIGTFGVGSVLSRALSTLIRHFGVFFSISFFVAMVTAFISFFLPDTRNGTTLRLFITLLLLLLGQGAIAYGVFQALRGKPVTIYGDGTQTRSFCYVDDLTDALLKLMDTPDQVTGPINLGNPAEFTISELAEKIVRLTRSRSKIVYEPLPLDDPARRRPDITLARQVLGWEPQIKVEDGLARTIDYFRGAIHQQHE
jgi:nucleoside-diphosphate-sugar epimerase